MVRSQRGLQWCDRREVCNGAVAASSAMVRSQRGLQQCDHREDHPAAASRSLSGRSAWHGTEGSHSCMLHPRLMHIWAPLACCPSCCAPACCASARHGTSSVPCPCMYIRPRSSAEVRSPMSAARFIHLHQMSTCALPPHLHHRPCLHSGRATSSLLRSPESFSKLTLFIENL